MLRYFKSKEFWFTLGGLVLFAVLVFVGLFYLFLPGYTKHGQSVVVPEVDGGSLEEAIEILEGAGLGVEIADSIFIAELEPNMVISQDPSGNSEVKPGRRIYLTVNKKVPPKVKVPDIFNVSTYQAKLLLDGAGLKIRKINYIPDEFKNLVRYAEFKGDKIEEGDTLPKFSEIHLFVGKGLGAQRIPNPDLVGMHYEEAVSTLHRVGLNIGPVKFDPKATESKGTIIRQSPKYYPEDSIVVGSAMTLFIAGPEPEEPLEIMNFGSDEVSDSSALESLPD